MKIISSKEIYNKDIDFFPTAEFDYNDSVSSIIEDVRHNGDKSIIKYSNKFADGNFNSSKDFVVTDEQIEAAMSYVGDNTISLIKKCIRNVESFATKQLECIKSLDIKIHDSQLGHRIIPLERVLAYVPGGNYPLPSSAIMTVVPAKVAGVRDIVVTSPKIKPQTIVAAKLSGANKIYKLGGAQAIAAFAYGTETIKSADKIVGPGNKYVTQAKKLVYGKCSIDFLAGPSEVLIVTDDKQDPRLISADLLAQCEHDKDARAILLCFSEAFAKQVIKCAYEQLETLSTQEIARVSFNKSLAVVVNDTDEAVRIANERAAEHLELMFDNAYEMSVKFNNYGSLFIGSNCAEVFGDYCSGTNHVLPTNGASRYTGGLSVFDFVKIQTYQMLSAQYASELSEIASALAAIEGLSGHKLASDLRRIQ